MLLALLCALLAVPSSADLWQSEQLPFQLDEGTSVGFALDASGAPGFTFRTYTGSSETSGLYYGYQSAGSWTSEIVDSGFGTGAANYLRYDGTTPYITYGAGTVDLDLTFATGGPGSWTTTLLADTQDPRHSVIDLDSNGNIAVSWIDQDADILGYMYHDGTGWSTPETVNTQPRVLAGMAVLLPGTVEDASIAFSQFDGSFFYTPAYAERDPSGSWNLDVGLGGTATFDDAGYLSGIVTGNGNPGLCYMDTWTGNIIYTEFDGATWNSETVVEIATQTTYPDRHYLDMARDDFGNLHLLYLNPETDQIEYRLRTSGGTWSEARTIHEGNGSWLRLALDEGQNPWFSYYADDEEALYFGQGNAVPEPATAALFITGLLSAAGFVRRKKTSGREQS